MKRKWRQEGVRVRGLDFQKYKWDIYSTVGQFMEHSIPLLTGEGWPNKRQALNLARPTVPAVKVSPELPSNRENLAENQQSKQQRGRCVGEQSWCSHLNTGCSCFLMDTPVISTFFSDCIEEMQIFCTPFTSRMCIFCIHWQNCERRF